MKPARRATSLLVVIACVAGTMAFGVALKAPCAAGDWGDGRQYTRLCYSDIVPLLYTEQLTGGRVPFIDRCGTHPDSNCDEYPVLTMLFMRGGAWISGSDGAAFYYVNTLLLLVCAAATAACLALLAGRRALLFALAPTLLVYGTMNWDLLPVALATGATLAFFRRRDGWAGVLFGLGVAAKAYPALFLIPFVVHRLRKREPDRAIGLLWTSVATWVVVNLPFAVISPKSWWEFFRFNSARVPDFDSLWYMVCSRFQRCPSTKAVNILSLGAFIVLVAVVWAVKSLRHPDFPRWSLGFPILVLFLLTNKVYSPQYGLWLLPWFVLALPNVWTWAAFAVADVSVFVTRFHWFHKAILFDPGWRRFEVSIWARAAVLVAAVLIWLIRKPQPLPVEELDDSTVRAESLT
ncbi:MAG: glycosyltransferase 87 family protein [Actinomycetota bacterium]|nr:glycosyltransferase 87 family protein [Actinomycetota bacterium]